MFETLHSWYSIGCGIRVAIICRPEVLRAANYVTFPAPKPVPRRSFLAALSDILFNKVNHLGRFYRISHEKCSELLCRLKSIFPRPGPNRP
jgi:hypothetical protein